MSALRHIGVVILVLVLGACAEFPERGAGGGGSVSVPGGVYMVSRGDTLYSIAWRHNLDYRTVARWNDISAPYTIYPGERIRLSPPAGGRAARADPAPRQPGGGGGDPPRRKPEARTEPTSAERSPSWRWPTDGRISRGFSKTRGGKRGIELAGDDGQPVRAAAAGRVVYSGSGLRGYGNLIIIKHNSRYLTAYGYNRQLLVEEGAQVDSGQRIALMGPGPDDSPALHFEIRVDGNPVDPASVLPAR